MQILAARDDVHRFASPRRTTMQFLVARDDAHR
jgi:hypothetical protein